MATTGNWSSISFNGSETGTPLRINPPFPVTYHVTETNAPPGFVVSTIFVQNDPTDFAFNPINGFFYVTNQGSNSVSVIDATTNTVVGAPIPVGPFPVGVAYNPINGYMYIANFGDTAISVIAPLTTTYSNGCNGTIDSSGQAAACDITNAYERLT